MGQTRPCRCRSPSRLVTTAAGRAALPPKARVGLLASSSAWWWPEARGVPQLADTSPQAVPLSSRGLLPRLVQGPLPIGTAAPLHLRSRLQTRPVTGSRGWGMGTHLGAPSPHSDSQHQVQLWSSWEMSTVPHHMLGPSGVSSWEATRGAPSCTWVAASGPPPGHPSAASPPHARRPSLGPSVPLKGVSRGPGQRQPARWEGRGTRTPGKGRFVFKLHVAVRRKNRKDITTYDIPNPGSIHGTRNSSFKGTKRN